MAPRKHIPRSWRAAARGLLRLEPQSRGCPVPRYSLALYLPIFLLTLLLFLLGILLNLARRPLGGFQVSRLRRGLCRCRSAPRRSRQRRRRRKRLSRRKHVGRRILAQLQSTNVGCNAPPVACIDL